MAKKNGKPQHISDLDILWAIRDIPAPLLTMNIKSVLFTMLATIGNCHNEWYYHSYQQWAEKIGCSPRSLPKLMQSLEDMNFILIKRPNYYGNGDSNEYKLNYEFILRTAEHFREQRTPTLDCR